MAREVWPEKDVIAESDEVVFLAVYRWMRAGDVPTTPRDPEPGAKAGSGSDTRDSEWAIRLDVRGYPQVRLLDGWGRPLPSSDRYASARTRGDVLQAIAAAKREGKGKPSEEAGRAVPPKSLLARLPADLRDEVARREPWVRARVWLRALREGRWKTTDLAALWDAEEDPVVRRAVLESLSGGDDDKVAARLVEQGLAGANDYARGAAIAACARVGGDVGVLGLVGVIEKALAGATGWKNPNNVLCDATKAAKDLPDLRLVPPLSKVLAKESANNSATLLAVQALVAIGEKHGMPKVKEPLTRARDLKGALEAQIRKAVDAAIGK